MAKDKFIQIRVSETLKERYMQALKVSAVDPDHAPTATDHLVGEIMKFIEAHEKKQKSATLAK